MITRYVTISEWQVTSFSLKCNFSAFTSSKMGESFMSTAKVLPCVQEQMRAILYIMRLVFKFIFYFWTMVHHYHGKKNCLLLID